MIAVGPPQGTNDVPSGAGARARRATHAKPRRGRALAAAMLFAASSAVAGPVLVVRGGAYCPHDRPPTAQRITAEQASDRARALLPADFCGPSWYVSGCVFEPEWALESWRVFVRQYKLENGKKEFLGRDHSYVVLDPVGNCVANIPGT
jgi:hypothetical protein